MSTVATNGVDASRNARLAREVERLHHANGALRAIMGALQMGSIDGLPCYCGAVFEKHPQHSSVCKRARDLWVSARSAGHI